MRTPIRLRVERGFTLVEVMIVVAILAVVAAIGAPEFSRFIADQRLRATATDLVASLLVARSEAIKRNADVTLARSASGWPGGWTVAAGGTEVDRRDLPSGKLDSPSSATNVVFQSTGRPTTAFALELRDAHYGTAITPRCVRVGLDGRPAQSRGSCP
jgi:type IV fimbrial biogenesis protein FimT